MFEYCYFGNALGLYHLFLRPDSAFLRRVSAPGGACAGRRGA